MGEMEGKVPRGSPFVSRAKSRLSDITNLHSRCSLAKHDELSTSFPHTGEDNVNKLIKVNITLVETLVERNKIIELMETELPKLRFTLQKLQLQNYSLARSNSQMTAELNIGKKKLETMEHQVACMNALLKVKKFEVKESEEAMVETRNNTGGVRRLPATRHAMRSQSCPSSTYHKNSDEEAKRRRFSVGRPMRKATEKVQSYKEIPLNVKMRRE